MTRDINALLTYEAKRRPELALMIQHIQNYSAHEINHTNFPKWIRQALLLRKKQYDANIESDRILASNADYIVDGNTPDPLGEMRRWVGGTQFIKINHGGSINVEPNALLWLPITGGIWIETIFCKAIDPQVFQFSQIVRISTKSDYRIACKEARSGLMPLENVASPTHYVGDTNYSFKITRL